MLSSSRISLVIPCFNEESQIADVLHGIPGFVDHVVVVDDKSTDRTLEVIAKSVASKDNITLIKHERNLGTGAARVSGIKKSLESEPDIICLCDGDGQMDLSILELLINPVLNGEADLIKGNRFFSGEAWQQMPKIRYFGNALLSLMTKVVSGYWHISDFQSGYIVMTAKVVRQIDLDHLYENYGFPNDLLIHANVVGARVKDFPVKPIYKVGEKSGINYLTVVPRIKWLLFRRFFWRLKEKYIIRDFHPLVFFYMAAIMLLLFSIPLAFRFFYVWYHVGDVPPITALALMFVLISGFQFLFFAMWFDMSYNKND